MAGKDRVREMTGYEKKSANEWDKVVAAAQKAAPQSPDYRAYVGRYHGVWRASCCSQSPVSRPKRGFVWARGCKTAGWAQKSPARSGQGFSRYEKNLTRFRARVSRKAAIRYGRL